MQFQHNSIAGIKTIILINQIEEIVHHFIPPLPNTQISGRYEEKFLEHRPSDTTPLSESIRRSGVLGN